MIKELVDRFADELKKADWDAYIQWITLTYELSEENADPALFYIEASRIDMEFIKCKIMDATEAEEIELYPDHSMEVINPMPYRHLVSRQ